MQKILGNQKYGVSQRNRNIVYFGSYMCKSSIIVGSCMNMTRVAPVFQNPSQQSSTYVHTVQCTVARGGGGTVLVLAQLQNNNQEHQVDARCKEYDSSGSRVSLSKTRSNENVGSKG